jgi:hypothetical protein
VKIFCSRLVISKCRAGETLGQNWSYCLCCGVIVDHSSNFTHFDY